jgi:DNA polymerase I
MARIIDTSTLTPDSRLDRFTDDAVYNGLDCCVTLEVLGALRAQLTNTTAQTYAFSMSLCAPVLEMNLHGVRVNRDEVAKSIAFYREDINHIRTNLDLILKEGVGYLKPWTGTGGMDSRIALMEIFYDVLRLPPVRKRNAEGKYVTTVNRAALEKLRTYTIAEPIVNHILAMRDLGKKIAFLNTEIDADGRIHTQFNIAGTVTGRLSSAISAFGTGTNLQNQERRLRRVFVPDPGYKFCNIDLEQADARNMGAILYNLFGDRSYLDACNSGDLHTTVCKMVWSDLPWSGDKKEDRRIADEPFYRDMSRRDTTKRLGHGSNYLGTASTMSINTKIPLELVRSFQDLYFGRFPNIRRWHDHVRYQLKHDRSITTLLGRKRNFFGRPDDESVIREAVAFEPQSLTSDEINEVLRTLWRSNTVECLLQVHDSILFQYKTEQETSLIPLILSKPFTFRVRDIDFFVPMEAKIGWNWADVEYNKDGTISGNPNGLIKYRTGGDTRNVDRRLY